MRGGDLRVGVWDAVGSTDENAAAPTVIAVHGITASHRCWPTVAAALPEFRVIAPDLRGRGRSRDLPGPYGMAQHTDDIAAVMDHLEVPRAVILGHSMGGFVTVAMHARHPDRVSAVVLADGGLPFEVPAGMSRDDYVDAVLGLVKQRLSMTFPIGIPIGSSSVTIRRSPVTGATRSPTTSITTWPAIRRISFRPPWSRRWPVIRSTRTT